MTTPILYANSQQRSWVLAPQATRWRHRFRGQRESWKVNLEMNQFLYDLRKVYEKSQTLEGNFSTYTYNVEFGATYAETYYRTDATPNMATIVLPGLQDLILRVDRLLKRAERLESNTTGPLIID